MERNLKGALLRTVAAAALAFGLAMPATALAEGQGEVPPPHTTEPIASPGASGAQTFEVDGSLAATMQSVFDAFSGLSAPSAPIATPYDSDVTMGDFLVSGGTKNTDYKLNGTCLEILTSTPLTIKNKNIATATTHSIQVNAGVHADLTLAGVNISGSAKPPINVITNNKDTASGAAATKPEDVRNPTSLHLTLADGTTNTLTSGKANNPGLRCGSGSVLVIDDSVRNVDTAGNPIVPQNGLIAVNATLQNGTSVSVGDPLTKMDSPNPGKLVVTGGASCAGIGGGAYEDAGYLTVEGGHITSTAVASSSSASSAGAGIGGGYNGGCTVANFNGGVVTTQGAYHGAGIGAGYGNQDYPSGTAHADAITHPRNSISATTAGYIYINGGYLTSNGGAHGNAFGSACVSNNANHIIKVTGGTLIPTSVSDRADLGGGKGYVIITGGSVKCASTSKFQGNGGTAYNTLGVTVWDDVTADPYKGTLPAEDQVFMVSINLKAEIQKRNTEAGITNDPNCDDTINSWKLLIGGQEYDYGSPNRFTDGILYLWLPKSATEKEITVDLSYTDKKGTVQKIEPLFRDPGTAQGGDLLKRYVSFEIPEEFTGSLTKYYDGTALKGLTVDATHQIPTEDGKVLSVQGDVSYKYQLFDAIDGNPLGPESASSKSMPANAGIMKLTIDSSEWGKDKEFSASYWGHRATGWCEIKPTTSKIDLVSAEWEDKQPGSVMETAKQRLTVNATVRKGDADPDGNPIGEHAQEPRGYIQLYVDGKPVGEPVKMVFAGDADEKGATIPANDPRVNATRVAEGEGAYTAFQYVFVPAEKDFLTPDATGDNKHEVSVQYLPPKLTDSEPANYLASTNPADDPEAPKTEVVIEPVDPVSEIISEPDPEAPEGAPEPTLTMDPNPTPTKPENHPTGDIVYPGDKTYTGKIETIYDEPTAEDPHPGRVILKLKSESSGSISVVDDDGNPFNVDFLRGDDGEPVRGDDGTYTLVLDPTAPGKGDLHIVQAPNGAFTGTHWDIEVVVKPNVKIAPKTSVSKTAENLTHPDGPTQPGDRIKYTISAVNTAVGSAWLDVTLTDALPVGLVLDPATVHLDNSSEMFDGPLTAGSPTALGEYELSAPGADGRPVLTALVGGVYGGRQAAMLTFECIVGIDAAGNDISNVAEAQGSRPDPENPDGGTPIPVTPDPTEPVTPPGGGKVMPGDPDVAFSKDVANVTDPGAKVTKPGDVLRYTVTLENKGNAGTCLMSAVVSDPMPEGIEPVAGTLQMTLADSTTVTVPDSAYDATSRTIAVTAGDVWGGQKVVLTFDATVTEAALGHDNSNIALVHGTIPSGTPDGTPPAGADPGQPVKPPAGEPLVPSPPAEPPTLVGDDPVDGDLKVNKTAENLTRQDGTTKVGDTVRYTISVTNSGTATSWMDAAIRDDIPRGLEPMAGTLKMTLANGKEIAVSDGAYDSTSRIMSVAAGHIYGGQTVTLAFDALVVEEAVGANIGNTASAYGQPPSAWDPEGMHPMPGEPFTPGDGWAVYERTRQRIQSPTAYAPGTTSSGGVIPADDANGLLPGTGLDQSGTITGVRLAKTGDEILRFALPIAACAIIVLATGAALGRLRRLID